MASVTGGCLCGKIRYEARGEPAVVGVCHCRHCQKQSGSALSVLAGYPRDAVAITGDLSVYEDRGESGGAVRRCFCNSCGSPIVSDVAAMPALLFIKAGTLDDPSWLRPGVHFFCESKQPWVPIADGVVQVPRNPA